MDALRSKLLGGSRRAPKALTLAKRGGENQREWGGARAGPDERRGDVQEVLVRLLQDHEHEVLTRLLGGSGRGGIY